MISLKQVSDLEELQNNLVRVKQESSNTVSFYQGDVRVVSVNLTQPSALKGEKGDPGLSVNELAGQPDDSWRQGQQGDMGDTGAKGNKGIPGVDAVVNNVVIENNGNIVSRYNGSTLVLPKPSFVNKRWIDDERKFIITDLVVDDSDEFNSHIEWTNTSGTLHLSFPAPVAGPKGHKGSTVNGVPTTLQSCKLVILDDGEPWSCDKTVKDHKVSYTFKVSAPAKGNKGDSGNGIIRKVSAEPAALYSDVAKGFASFSMTEGVPVVKILSDDNNSFVMTGNKAKVSKEKVR